MKGRVTGKSTSEKSLTQGKKTGRPSSRGAALGGVKGPVKGKSAAQEGAGNPYRIGGEGKNLKKKFFKRNRQACRFGQGNRASDLPVRTRPEDGVLTGI